MPDQLALSSRMVTPAQLAGFLANLKTITARAVAGLPAHEDYLKRHCPADPALLAA
jgi:tryptophan halogenase